MIKNEKQLSSGGVIYRKTKEGIEVALVSVKGGTVWCLPKGLVEEHENIARTAHREVKEETGLDGRIIEKIGHVEYFYSHKEDDITHRIFKIVYFFLMEYTGGDVSGHDDEVVDCQWFQIDEGIKRLEYKDEREILKKAKEMIMQ